MRVFPPALDAGLEAGRVRYAGLIRFDLGEGSFGFIRSAVPHTYGGVTFKAMPEGLISVSDFSFVSGTAASGFTLQISESQDNGITADVLLNIEDYDYRDRPVTIYDLHVDPDTGASLGDPVAQMRGYINQIRHIDDPSSGALMSIECESRAIDYSRQNGRSRTDVDQKRRASGDRFFEHAGTAGRIKIKFGKA